jgi:hypothetical protein
MISLKVIGMGLSLSQTDCPGKDTSVCIATARYGTERMRQKLLVVASGVLVNISTPTCSM